MPSAVLDFVRAQGWWSRRVVEGGRDHECEAMHRKSTFWLDSLHLLILTNFAFAQPLFDRVAHKVSYLDSQGIRVPALVTFVLLVALGVPAALILLTRLVESWSSKIRERVHVVLVYLLLLVILLPFLRLIRVGPIEGMSQLFLTLLVAGVASYAYKRFGSARLLVTAACPAVLVFPAIFFFYSPVSAEFFPPPAEKAVPLTVSNPVPIVMLVLDEFNGTSLMNADHAIDATRFPNFASLAREATWYRNASTVHPRTEQAVPAILTGRYPPPPYSKLDPDSVPNLFTLLDSTARYEMIVFEPYTQLYPREIDEEPLGPVRYTTQLRALFRPLPAVYIRNLLPLDLPFEPPDIPREWFGIQLNRLIAPEKTTGLFRPGWGTGRVAQFEQFLSRIEPADQPRLYFSHIVLPHFPWAYLPSGKKYDHDDGEMWAHADGVEHLEHWHDDEIAVVHGYQRYLLQLGCVDHLIGRLIARLKEAAVYDDCLLIIVADHGVSFRPGLSRRLPTSESLEDILSIPLFVKLPGQRDGAVSDRNVWSLDVLPTVLDVLDADRPIATDGRSLLDTQPDRPTKVLVYNDERHIVDGAFESKYKTLEHRQRLFPYEAEADGLFRIGPYASLIGRAVDDFPHDQSLEVEVQRTRRRVKSLEGERDLVQCHLRGRVTASSDDLPLHLAISVDGTIRAVTRTYSTDDPKPTWSAMLPESAVASDAHVEIFIISERNGAVHLLSPRSAQAK